MANSDLTVVIYEISNNKFQITNKFQWPEFKIPNMYMTLKNEPSKFDAGGKWTEKDFFISFGKF